MTRFLDGVSIRYYRGVGPQRQVVGPFSQINLFIGANNSGKSTVLSLLSDLVNARFLKRGGNNAVSTDAYRGEQTGSLEFSLGVLKEELFESCREKFNLANDRVQCGTLQTVLNKIAMDSMVWITPTDRQNIMRFQPPVDAQLAKNWISDRSWYQLWSTLTNKQGGSIDHHWIPGTLEVLASIAAPSLPSIHLIPAKRQLGSKGEEFDDLSGKGLIDHLASLQNPSHDRQSDRQKFTQINNFLREITGKANAQLEVPSEREHLLVHMDNKVLPLSSLGTGIHEVVLIAAFCTIHDKSIMCIEEPEIHLHPLLQRKLLRYMTTETSSQYFIATHSSAFLDTPDANIFHVSNDGVQTYVQSALARKDQRKILDELGAQASDILQSNAVIWVEGPSDRIYLRHWISCVAPDLVEGIHYSIMFYGGALIKHLSASDDALEQFISLQSLNRHMAVVLDSDRDAEGADLKPHAKRLVEEIEGTDGVVWVTAGREIENYSKPELLQSALKQLHGKIYRKAAPTGPYDHAFYFYREDPKKPSQNKIYKQGDKVGAASIICENDPDLDRLDLRARVNELVEMIHQANHATRKNLT